MCDLVFIPRLKYVRTKEQWLLKAKNRLLIHNKKDFFKI